MGLETYFFEELEQCFFGGPEGSQTVRFLAANTLSFYLCLSGNSSFSTASRIPTLLVDLPMDILFVK